MVGVLALPSGWGPDLALARRPNRGPRAGWRALLVCWLQSMSSMTPLHQLACDRAQMTFVSLVLVYERLGFGAWVAWFR